MFTCRIYVRTYVNIGVGCREPTLHSRYPYMYIIIINYRTTDTFLMKAHACACHFKLKYGICKVYPINFNVNIPSCLQFMEEMEAAEVPELQKEDANRNAVSPKTLFIWKRDQQSIQAYIVLQATLSHKQVYQCRNSHKNALHYTHRATAALPVNMHTLG